jgi:hypothetical protein
MEGLCRDRLCVLRIAYKCHRSPSGPGAHLHQVFICRAFSRSAIAQQAHIFDHTIERRRLPRDAGSMAVGESGKL